MIDVVRRDVEAKELRIHGKTIRRPASYTCRYYYNAPNGERREIAMYRSVEDIVRVRTEYIYNDFSMSHYERALRGQFSDAYRYLFDMLNIDKDTRMSEYMNA